MISTFENETAARGRLREDSQCGKILATLKAAAANAQTPDDAWVPMPSLVLVSGSYNIHSRIDELRHNYGYTIENHTDVSVRPHVSKYRLVQITTP